MLSGVRVVDPFANEEDSFIGYLEEFWYEHSMMPTTAQIIDKINISEEAIVEYFNSEKFRKKCELLGIRLPYIKTKGNLTPKQLAVVNALMDYYDGRSDRKVLADFGVSSTAYQGWLRDPAFRDYLERRAEQLLGEDTKVEAKRALLSKVRTGDVQAIKYANEVLGVYRPAVEAAKASVEAKAAGESFDPKRFLFMTLEIISKYVGREVLELVKGDFEKLLANPSNSINPTPLAPLVIEGEKSEPV